MSKTNDIWINLWAKTNTFFSAFISFVGSIELPKEEAAKKITSCVCLCVCVLGVQNRMDFKARARIFKRRFDVFGAPAHRRDRFKIQIHRLKINSILFWTSGGKKTN